MMGWDWGWGMLIGGILMLLFWGGVIVFAIWAVRALVRSERNRDEGRPAPSQESSALEILKQRYARGEISREEYQSMRSDLER